MRLFRHYFVKKIGATLLVIGLCISGAACLNPLVYPAQTGPKSDESALCLSGMTIFVDAGHGGYDGGSRAKDSGVWEKVFNLSISLKTQQALEKMGAKVIMSRTEDIDLVEDTISNLTKKRRDLKNRLEMAEQGGVDMLLCIHMNEYRARSESGPHVFYRKNHDASRLLAGCMQQSLIDALKPKRKRVAQSGDYFMLSLNLPSVLVECGFISNPQEEKLLLDDAYQLKVADAIAQGVCTYMDLASRGQGDVL